MQVFDTQQHELMDWGFLAFGWSEISQDEATPVGTPVPGIRSLYVPSTEEKHACS
jgi:hypothetical protein